MLKIGYGAYGLDLFGGYAHPTTPSGTQFASFFAFGVLHAPIGGVPAFFITGIGLGFGINRELQTPTIDEVNTNPFMVALRAIRPDARADAAAAGHARAWCRRTRASTGSRPGSASPASC